MPGDLPDPEIESASPALAGSLFTTNTTWEAFIFNFSIQNDYSPSCPIPVLLRIEKYQRKAGIEIKQDPMELLGTKASLRHLL